VLTKHCCCCFSASVAVAPFALPWVKHQQSALPTSQVLLLLLLSFLLLLQCLTQQSQPGAASSTS
jgi:hypothetical protein